VVAASSGSEGGHPAFVSLSPVHAPAPGVVPLYDRSTRSTLPPRVDKLLDRAAGSVLLRFYTSGDSDVISFQIYASWSSPPSRG